MPCEGCNIQFTVFRRKRPCSQCRRYFCNHCLTKRNQNILCERCVIFAKRPLTRADLLNLKPKDLIFYLQSKHISTTGCVEKEELVNLILANTDVGSMPSNAQNEQHQPSSNNDDSENCSNPFDQLKQTCQNLFNSFTDRISSDLGFDTKQATSPTSSNSNCNFYDTASGIITREIPTYSESINRNVESGDGGGQGQRQTGVHRPTNLVPNTTARTTTTTTTTYNNINYLSPCAPNVTNDVFSSASSPSSPINSISSMSSNSILSQAINQSSNPNQRNQVQNRNNNDNGNVSSPSSSSSQTRTHQVGFEGIPSVHKSANNRKIFKNVTSSDGNGSGCDCSDDEIITKYNTRQRSIKPIHNRLQSSSPQKVEAEEERAVVDKCSPISQGDSAFEDQIAGPSGSTAESSNSNSKSLNDDHQVKSSDGSSGSSFEELGAVGGGGGCTSTSSDNENWQMVNKVEIPPYSTFTRRTAEKNDWYKAGAPGPSRLCTDHNDCDNDTFLLHSNISSLTDRPVGNHSSNKHHQKSQQKSTRRITRRRSDSYIYKQNQQNTSLEVDPSVFQQVDEESDEGEHDEIKSRKRVKKSCRKCGKSKKSIEGQVDKFRQQLESSQLSAAEIRRELAAFVEYLEQRAKSFDVSDDSETNHEQGTEVEDNSGESSSRQSGEYEVEENNDSPPLLQQESLSSLSDNHPEIMVPDAVVFDHTNDGIYVYAPEEATTYQQQQRLRHDPRFINLIDYKSSAELDDLSVKQLKEVLSLNRVDFKGCCEKRELLDRVKRLWKELHSCPEVEKIPADDLCKICMDAPIECVILECGHMATCTNCGKVLNECPICRQYIVRVVRFFRA